MSVTNSLSSGLNSSSILLMSLLATSAILMPCLSAPSQAEPSPITSSGLNTHVSAPITLPTTQTQYDITDGTRPGGGANLFHSFGDFNVPPNNIANFQNTLVNGAFPHTDNILARVTGSSGNNPTLSSIYGTIQTTGFGNANLFLMNPAGFLFGKNATVNVGGMMTFTTADYLKLTGAGNVSFNAIPDITADLLLSAAPVAAFGFLGSNPAAISFNFEGGQLTVANGAGIALVGGNFSLMPDPSGTPSSITAPGRPIQLTSVVGRGEVAADTVMPASGMALGTITLGQGTVLSTAGDSSFGDGSGGPVSIRGGQVVATGASIVTNPADDSTGQGGIVMIAATGPVSLTNSDIDTSSASFFSAGSGGAVNITASDLTLQDHSFIRTGSGGGFFSITGSGGAVTLRGTNIFLIDSGIDTEAVETTGSAGPVTITADQTVMIVGSPALGSSAIDTSIHNNSEDPTVAGHGGNIEITGTNVTLTDSTQLQSVADGVGTFSQGGNILIIGSKNVVLHNGTTLLTTTVSQAPAGNIELMGQHVTITQSSLFSNTLAAGASGAIKITGTGDIALNAGSMISTDAGLGSEGTGGPIEINTPHLTITGGSQVASETSGSGAGGNITITAGQSVTLNHGSSISASSTGLGNAGNILIDAGQNYTSTDSTVSTQAAQASGGNITVLATDMVHLTNSQLNASVQGSSTTVGGNITIDPQYVILQNSQILAQATQGQGGAISITIANSGLFLADANSTISASSQFGVNGTITIQSPNAPISGQIQPLGKTPLIATSLLNQHCAALAGGRFSSFTVAGRDSLPTEPGSWLASPLATLNAGMGLGVKAEGGRLGARGEGFEDMSASAGQVASGQWRVGDIQILSLRQIAPAGFLTQAFAVDGLTSCHS